MSSSTEALKTTWWKQTILVNGWCHDLEISEGTHPDDPAASFAPDPLLFTVTSTLMQKCWTWWTGTYVTIKHLCRWREWSDCCAEMRSEMDGTKIGSTETSGYTFKPLWVYGNMQAGGGATTRRATNFDILSINASYQLIYERWARNASPAPQRTRWT